jgi:hypothetical protein
VIAAQTPRSPAPGVTAPCCAITARLSDGAKKLQRSLCGPKMAFVPKTYRTLQALVRFRRYKAARLARSWLPRWVIYNEGESEECVRRHAAGIFDGVNVWFGWERRVLLDGMTVPVDHRIVGLNTPFPVPSLPPKAASLQSSSIAASAIVDVAEDDDVSEVGAAANAEAGSDMLFPNGRPSGFVGLEAAVDPLTCKFAVFPVVLPTERTALFSSPNASS